MAKTQEELNALKEEMVTLNEKLHELTEEELAQVAGGAEIGDGGNVGEKKSFWDLNPFWYGRM